MNNDNRVNPFEQSTVAQGQQQSQVGTKTTDVFHYQLPNSVGVPEFIHRWKQGGYEIADPVQVGVKANRKVLMLLNSTVTNVLNDIRGLERRSTREVIRQIFMDPQVLSRSQVNAQSPDDVVDRAYFDIKSQSFANNTAEWAQAVAAWIDVVDYGVVDKDMVPDTFAPYVNAYLNTIDMYGLTFNGELSNRLVTSAGEDGVTPADGAAIVSNTNRVYTDPNGLPVSLRLTTSSRPEYRLPGMVANAGIASKATRIIMRGGSAGWDKDSLGAAQWESACFGIIHLPRGLNNNGEASCSIRGFNAESQTELAYAAMSVFNANNAGETLFDNEAFAPQDPIAAAISQVTTQAECSALWQKYQDQWDDSYTKMAFERLMSLGQQ